MHERVFVSFATVTWLQRIMEELAIWIIWHIQLKPFCYILKWIYACMCLRIHDSDIIIIAQDLTLNFLVILVSYWYTFVSVCRTAIISPSSTDDSKVVYFQTLTVELYVRHLWVFDGAVHGPIHQINRVVSRKAALGIFCAVCLALWTHEPKWFDPMWVIIDLPFIIWLICKHNLKKLVIAI